MGESTLSEQIADQANVAYCLKRQAAVARARARLFGLAVGLLEAVRAPVCNYYKARSFHVRAHHLYGTFPADLAVEWCQKVTGSPSVVPRFPRIRLTYGDYGRADERTQTADVTPLRVRGQ